MHRLAAPLLAATLIAVACAPVASAPAASPSAPPLRIGAGPDAETELLAHVLAELLEQAGLGAEVTGYSSAFEARQALEFGDLDVLPGYTGAVWLDALGRPDPPRSAQESFRRVRAADRRSGIVWLPPAPGADEGLEIPPANATFAFFVRGVPSLDASIRSMSQLATRLGEDPGERLCVDPGFARREDGLPAVQLAYAIRDRIDVLGVSPEEAIRGVAAGACLAGLSTATDGRAWAAGLLPLHDDLEVFPAFVVGVQVTDDLAAEQPRAVAALTPLPAHLTTRMLGLLNARVVSGMPVEVIAAEAAERLRLTGAVPDRMPPAGSPSG